MPKKKGDRAQLTPTDKEVIHQTYAATGNKSETARRCSVAVGTVHRVLKQAGEDGTPIKQARSDAAVALANKLHVRAEELIDSISDEDIESGRIRLEDKTGKFLGYKYFGPSLLQKATAVGIIVDKASVVQTYEKGLQSDILQGKLLLPEDIEGLKSAIEGKVKELNVLNIRFADENPTLLKETQEIVAEVERIEENEAARAEVTSFDEFDGP